MGEAKDVYGDYALIAVPLAARRSLMALFMEHSGNIGCIAAIWGGGVIGTMHDVPTMIVAVLIGSIILAFLGLLVGFISGYSRGTCYTVCRYPFGRVGSMIVGLLPSGLGCLAWFAVETWLFGVMIESIFRAFGGPGFGYPWTNIAVASIWGGILMVITAYGGFAWLIMFSYATAPLFFLLAVIGLGAAVDYYGGIAALMAARPATPMPIAAGITATVGLYACGAVIVGDAARFGKKPRDGGFAWFIHILAWMPMLMLCGGFMVLLTGAPHIGEAMVLLGMGIGAMVLTVAGQWKINDSNLWYGSLSWVNSVGWKITRRMWVLIMGIVGIVWAYLIAIGYGPSMEFFTIFAIFLGKVIPPIGAIMIADFFIIRPYMLGIKDPYKRYPFGPGTKYSSLNWCGIVALIIAAALCGYTEPTIPAVGSSMIIGFFIHLALMALCIKTGIRYEFGEWTETETGF